MTMAAWILLALGTATLCLDAYAIRKIYVSELYETHQFVAQGAMILFVPVLGALLSLCVCHESTSLSQKPPVDLVQDIDGTCSDIDYHG
ncbi:hypothetical protein GCM10027321_36250 [Massilia terrae]|uniref:Uncharacterized protein n=1 Tax=Massilia terrae TaxID=1811224 RepID=A0ABT2D3H9_9BURK|nr:hypothetical protein [Massilia terrae]MCS0660792.1 hypothetical protein [Massilia terrae]